MITVVEEQTLPVIRVSDPAPAGPPDAHRPEEADVQFMVIFTNKPEFLVSGMPDDFADRMREDTAHIRQLYAEGVVREVWTIATRDRGGVALFEADSRAHLDGVLADVPFVKIGYNDHQVLPLAPYPGFAGVDTVPS